MPVRIIAIHLDWPDQNGIRIEQIDSSVLLDNLLELDKKFLRISGDKTGGIFYQRVAKVYDTVNVQNKKIPTMYFIKPNQIRYWTRSIAMRDADEVAADIMLWKRGKGK